MSDLSTPPVLFQQFNVMTPVTEDVLIISVTQWQTTMDRIKACEDHSGFYESLAWAFFGVATTALFVALTFPASVEFVKSGPPPPGAPAGQQPVATPNLPGVFTEVFATVGGLACLAVWWVSLRYAKDHRTDRVSVRLMIVDDMRLHMERQAARPPPVNPPQAM